MDYISFARLFGMVSVILSLGILFNMGASRKMANDIIGTPAGYIMGGVLPLIFGGWALVHNNNWHLGWHLAVTVIGWLMMLIGIFRVMLVDHWVALLKRYVDVVPALFALFGLIMGLLLLYVGFVAHHL